MTGRCVWDVPAAGETMNRAVVNAADHPHRKQYYVGASTVATILANKPAPALLDRYLARTGYASQQTDGNEPGTRTANLWHPADEAPEHDYGAHGSFDETSHPRSAQAALARHRGLVSAAAPGAGVVGLGAVIRRRRLRQPGKRRCSVRRVARGDVMGVVQRQQRGAAARAILRRLRSEQETDVVAAVDPVLHAADEPGGGLVEDQ